MIAITFLLLFVQIGTAQSAASPLDRLRAKVPVGPVTNVVSEQLAGQYSSSSEELRKRVGSFLDGDDLYLFPNGTYIYCEWADIEPYTVRDKGTWVFADGILTLTSDSEITWDPETDRKYVVVYRMSHSKEIFLVGIERALPRFEEEASNDPEFTLLLVGKARVKPLNQATANKLKAKLFRESWHPEYFLGSKNKEQPPKQTSRPCNAQQ